MSDRGLEKPKFYAAKKETQDYICECDTATTRTGRGGVWTIAEHQSSKTGKRCRKSGTTVTD